MTTIDRFPHSKWHEAMANLLAEVEGIKPGAHHSHSGYSYATADQLFDMVRPLLAKHGFTLICDEIDCVVTDQTTKSGGRFVLSKFSFRLFYEGEAIGDVERMTVGNVLLTPQSLCASRTYAVKYYLRTKFLININEKDEEHLVGAVQEEMTQKDVIRGATAGFEPRTQSKAYSREGSQEDLPSTTEKVSWK